MRFDTLPGHEDIKRRLRGLKESGHIPHALMLTGPSGSGKMILARTFAQYLHCQNPANGEPCGHCNNCRLHQENSHPDLHFIYPIVKNKKGGITVSADRSNEWFKMLADYPAMPEEKWLEIIEAGNSQPTIYVEEAAEIIRADSTPAYTSSHKIFIIWRPERLGTETANKLLKVIEEPAEDTIFILVCNNELQLLPTIFSRVQRIPVGRLSQSEIAEYLHKRYNFIDSTANQYAALCNGSLIRADELGQNSGEREEFLEIYREVMRSAYAKRVLELRKLSEKIAAFGREKIRRYLDYTASMLRENFIYNMRVPQLNTLTPEEEQFSSRFSPFVNHLNVERFLIETDRAKREVERNANSKIVLFDYFLLTIILLHKKK
ncbi:MAG: DNA polymerase III subunit delta [Muribaculaceae bacterium]|nr:DNA polymerase III subunit delta [Muribaculaceae bacterium]